MRRIRRENPKRYKSYFRAILHTKATNPNFIARIATFPERNSTGCIIESTAIGYIIINKGDVVDMFSVTSPGNDIPEGTS